MPPRGATQSAPGVPTQSVQIPSVHVPSPHASSGMGGVSANEHGLGPRSVEIPVRSGNVSETGAARLEGSGGHAPESVYLLLSGGAPATVATPSTVQGRPWFGPASH